MSNYLNDKEFLQQLDKYNNKKFFAKLIVTDKDDNSLETIEGLVTGGSVNIDGKSAVRRTCSLSLTTMENEEQNKTMITDAYWSLKSRFKLEIGINNEINSKYPNIIWFKQGVFVINNFNKTYNTNGSVNISISGQDKMALLNGTLGGHFLSEADLGAEDIIDEQNNITTNKLPIKSIIKNLLLVFAKERLENIVINDLDDYGWELWEYRGDKPLYIYYQPYSSGSGSLSGEVINMTIDGNTLVTLEDNTTRKISELDQYYSLNTLKSEYNSTSTTVVENEKEYKVIKIELGETAGYHKIDLTYNSDLIMKAGETITGALDKLKNMLVNFEYFYDIDGRFVFQKKKERLQEFLTSNSSEMIAPTASTTSYSYKFDDLSMITNLSPAFKIDNVKNDFTIWGTKNQSLPFHIRYAIDKKPFYYKTLSYLETRKMSYLKLNNYTNGKCYVKDGNKFRESYNIEYDSNFKTNYTRYYYQAKISELKFENLEARKTEGGLILIDAAAAEESLPTGNYQIEIKPCDQKGVTISDPNIITEKISELIKFNLLGTKKVSKGVTKSETIYENCPINSKRNLNVQSKFLTLQIKLIISEDVLKDTAAQNILKDFFANDRYFELLIYPQKNQYNITETTVYNTSGLYYMKNGEYIKYDAYNEAKTDYDPEISNTNLDKIGIYKYKHKEKIYSTQELSGTTYELVPWQEIIYQMAKDYYRHNTEDDFLYNLQENNIVNNKPLYMYGQTGYEQYYQDIQGHWRLLYNPEEKEKKYGSQMQKFYTDGEYKYWNKNVYNNSDLLPFWFDFLDFGDGAEFSKYSVKNIGQRTKVLNDSKINSILYKEIPEIQFYFSKEEIDKNTAYNPILLQSNMENMFVRSSQGVSAIEKMNDLLNEHAYYSSSLSFTTLPIWYLQPNTKVYVEGQGDCIVQGISFNLSHNTTMNLTCVKILDSYAQ